jgi:uncharacterized protein YjeT (DUF2065 family)
MNWTDLFAALCLVLVIEGLALLVAPVAWRRMATLLSLTTDRSLRLGGGAMILIGLVALQLLRT